MKRTCTVWIVASVSALTVWTLIAHTDSCRFLLNFSQFQPRYNKFMPINLKPHFTSHVSELGLCAIFPFQIRRYVYNDVIKLDDATKLIDCTLVQVSEHFFFQLNKDFSNYNTKQLNFLSIEI